MESNINKAIKDIDSAIDHLNKAISELDSINKLWANRYRNIAKALLDAKNILQTYKDFQVEFEIKE